MRAATGFTISLAVAASGLAIGFLTQGFPAGAIVTVLSAIGWFLGKRDD